jgi:hypothetical protein
MKTLLLFFMTFSATASSMPMGPEFQALRSNFFEARPVTFRDLKLGQKWHCLNSDGYVTDAAFKFERYGKMITNLYGSNLRAKVFTFTPEGLAGSESVSEYGVTAVEYVRIDSDGYLVTEYTSTPWYYLDKKSGKSFLMDDEYPTAVSNPQGNRRALRYSYCSTVPFPAGTFFD